MKETEIHDTVDRVVGYAQGSATHAIRHARAKVVAATQGSEDGLFDPALPGLSVQERLLVAILACALVPAAALVGEYRARLEATGADPALIESVARGEVPSAASTRLAAILRFAHTLTTDPVKADKAALLRLKESGLSTPEIVTLAQLIAFISDQTRVVAGLRAMQKAEARA